MLYCISKCYKKIIVIRYWYFSPATASQYILLELCYDSRMAPHRKCYQGDFDQKPNVAISVIFVASADVMPTNTMGE